MDFEVVVLAGGTSRKLNPLVSQEIPKALLPVANRPVLSYVLELLEASNLKDLIVVSSFSPPILLSENLTVRCLGFFDILLSPLPWKAEV
ncbi:hypothetical protein B296_00028391 [Ensete ventricosum]|uniref:Translation initiation factor eIF2B subunit gamma n=1 Tax=Ensete ventricosum TaxID=4639 RepID=A0A426XNC9_ENSVE|nr:hypothetical protein B296_00028391 [Ensete ventricosum]